LGAVSLIRKDTLVSSSDSVWDFRLDVLTPRFKLRLAPFVKPGAAKQHPDGAYLWMLLPTTAVQDLELRGTSSKCASTHLHKNNGIVPLLCGGGGPYASAVRQPMVIVHAHRRHDPCVR
jgi:hypothetical protein